MYTCSPLLLKSSKPTSRPFSLPRCLSFVSAAFKTVVLRTSWRLCVNEQTAPLVKKEMPFLDPYGLAEEMDLDLEDSEVSLVDFKATGDMAWLEQLLEKPARFWLQQHHKIPLLLEIRQLIEAKKDLKKTTRLVGNHKCLIPLKVRGRIL